jgi:4-hydroxybenzoyl-CoA thioesterase
VTTETFSFRRRVAFGECDPARIYYTPRAVDFAVEAVEAWYEAVLGVSWCALIKRHELDANFTQVNCRYLRPLVPSQVIQVKVRITGVGSANVKFQVTGEGNSGEAYFQVTLVACFVDRNRSASIPIPRDYRERIETYRALTGEKTAVQGGDEQADLLPWREDAGHYSLRQVPAAGAVPFTRQRRVIYGECGVSGTVYTPRVFDYIVETIGEWYEEIPRISWLEMAVSRNEGTPFVSAHCKYLRPMVPGEAITIGIWINRLGVSSIGFAVAGFDARGLPCFEARLVACYTDYENGFKSMPVPEEYRRRIQAYQEACAAGERECGLPSSTGSPAE